MGAGQRDTPLCPHPSPSRLARCASSPSPLPASISFGPQNSPCHTTGANILRPFSARLIQELFFSSPCPLCTLCGSRLYVFTSLRHYFFLPLHGLNTAYLGVAVTL